MKRTALITGASSGIGLELARVFAGKGYDLVITARQEAKLIALAEELKEKHGSTVLVTKKNLAEREQVYALYRELKEKNITVDVLVNNAGFGDMHSFADEDPEKVEGMIDVNIRALTVLSRLLAEDMQKRKQGKIMNIASTAAFQPGPGMAVYFATKAYVLHLSEALYQELKGSGVHVIAICPGPTESAFMERSSMENSPLIKGRKLPSSAELAEFAYKKMTQGQMTSKHGLLNRIGAFSVRFLPRKLVVLALSKVMKKA